MRVLTFGIDSRALMDIDGHSKRWNSRMGGYVHQLDVIVQVSCKEETQEKWIAPNVRILPVYVPNPLLYSYLAYRAALREHKLHPYDLVTAEDPFRTGLAAVLFKRRTGVAFSLEYHTETFFNWEWIKTRLLIHTAYDLIGRYVVHHADSVRCANRKNCEQIRKLTRLNPLMPVEAIPVPTEFYDPERDDPAARKIRETILGGPEGFLVLFIGRLAPVKKVDELLEVFSRIERQFDNAWLVLVGEGPDEQALRAQALALGLKRVVFKGYVPENEVMGYYGACDLFVNPAHNETFGRVYIEAMSAGKPVVTTSGTGAVEQHLCVDHLTALVIEPGDLEALEQSICELIRNEELRQWLGGNALKLVKLMFDYEQSLVKMKNLWEKTLVAAQRQATPGHGSHPTITPDPTLIEGHTPNSNR